MTRQLFAIFALIALVALLALACSLPQRLLGSWTAPSNTPTRTATDRPPAPPTEAPAPTSTAEVPPTPSAGADPNAGQIQAMRPEFVGDVGQLASATRYLIEASVDLDLESQEARIDGVARIRFTNPLPEPLEDLVLMLWPNDNQYQSAMTAGPVLIGAGTLDGELEMGGIAMRVVLPEALAAGETLDASVPFSVQVDGPMRPQNPKRFTITEDVLLAPTFYPLVPRLVEGEWQVLPAPPGGDTTNSDVAFYEVHLTTPAQFALAASGVEVGQAENSDGTVTTSFATGPVRDFAFALGPLQLTERTVEGVLLRAWVLPQHAGDSRGMLEAAAAQVRALTEAIGPYPYAELDLVDAPEAYGGIEYPGLVFIGTLGTFAMVEPVVHEVGHQWFYGVVGNDQLLDPWLDEGAATFTEILYYESAFGVQRGTTALEALRQVVEIEPEVAQMPVGLPVSEFRDEFEYAVVAYYKGALFFEALRRELGPDLFGDFLHMYYQEYRYQVATPEGFQNVAEETCGCDLDALFDLWVFEGGPIPGP